MKKYAGLFFLLVLSQYGNAQGQLMSQRFLQRVANNMALNGLRVYEAEGTPYINDAFVMGNVYLTKAELASVPMRYNIHEDQFEFKQGDSYFVLDPKFDIDSVKLANDTFVVKKINGKDRLVFLLRLEKGKAAQLLEKKIVRFKEATEPSAMQYNGTPAKFTTAPSVYYMKIENELIEIDNFKKIISKLTTKQDELNAFVKKEKLSANKEEDVRKFVQYYNSLI